MAFTFYHPTTSRRSIVVQQQRRHSANTIQQPQKIATTTTTTTQLSARYGPKEEMPDPTKEDDDFFANQDQWEAENKIRLDTQRIEFQNLLNQILTTTAKDPSSTILPGLLSKNVDLFLNMRGFEGVQLMKEAMQDAEESGDEERVERVSLAVDAILNFMEEFVDQAKMMDSVNKELLGKIIRAMTGAKATKDDDDEEDEKEEEDDDDDGEKDQIQRAEERLDQVLEHEKENFTPGFLRHIEGECTRIANAPKMTRESARLLQMMRVIQARVVEELGKDLGEGALVLGQLLGYDDKDERFAVLNAGLQVRGISFAKELSGLTKEALEGFSNIPGDAVDPTLVARVIEIDGWIDSFLTDKTIKS